MTQPPSPDLPDEATGFDPVPTAYRHDGWTPDRQHDFIVALAESGCVTEAAKAVGMTTRGAYRLRARPDASAFRQAWDIALDYAIRRLTDAAFSRALHGVSRPVFYQGEQIGERRHYDERLTMFLLRYRDPTRYGAWLDGYEARRHPDGAGIVLAHALNAVMDSAHDFAPHEDEDDGGPGWPLAEGPRRDPARPTAEDARGLGHLPADVRDLALTIRASVRAAEEERNTDPAAGDWRDPLPRLRPRKARNQRGVP
jgi:hypothetical protein